MSREYSRLRCTAGVLLISGLLTAAWGQPRQFKPGFNIFSKDQDIQLGREAAAQVESQKQIVKDAAINDFIQSIGKRLASQPQAGGFPYTFQVVNDPAINAFALPGGPTFVNTGLIRAADNEAQIAGVMAHEISHVALRHGTNQASKANLIELPALLAGQLAGNRGMLGQLAQLGIGLGANSVLLKFSRTDESEADLLGAQIMAQAGYDPLQMARFFEKLEAQGGNGGPQFLSDHPNPGNRRKAIQAEINQMPRRSYTTGDTVRFRQVQARVNGLPKPTAQQNMQEADRVAALPQPSSRLKSYRSRRVSFSFPESWEASGDVDSYGKLIIGPRDGIVPQQNGDAIGYGVELGYYQPPDGIRPIDVNKQTVNLIVSLQRSNPSLTLETDPRWTTVGGQDGLTAELTSKSPIENRVETDVLLTAGRPEGLFYAVFVAPRAQFEAARPVFDHIISSIQF
jgi:beta-barrel assembly-enhancing protease